MGLGDPEGSCWQVTFPTVPSLVFLQVSTPVPCLTSHLRVAVSSPASFLSSAFVRC